MSLPIDLRLEIENLTVYENQEYVNIDFTMYDQQDFPWDPFGASLLDDDEFETPFSSAPFSSAPSALSEHSNDLAGQVAGPSRLKPIIDRKAFTATTPILLSPRSALRLFDSSPESTLEESQESEESSAQDEVVPSSVLQPPKHREVTSTLPKRARNVASPYPTPPATPPSARSLAARPQTQSHRDPLICPVCGIQWKGRPMDFARHKKTHEDERWICCGYPKEVVARKPALLHKVVMHNGVPSVGQWGLNSKRKRVTKRKEVVHNGVLHVGGCGYKFKRECALQRHIHNTNNPCVGDVKNVKYYSVMG